MHLYNLKKFGIFQLVMLKFSRGIQGFPDDSGGCFIGFSRHPCGGRWTDAWSNGEGFASWSLLSKETQVIMRLPSLGCEISGGASSSERGPGVIYFPFNEPLIIPKITGR